MPPPSSPLPPRPDGRLRVVIDTDAANEIDDQFALVWALLATDRLDIVGIHAAPFGHGPYFAALDAAADHRGAPGTGFEELAVQLGAAEIARLALERPLGEAMERSFAEIERVVDVVGPAERPPIVRGATSFMTHRDAAVSSDAVDHLIALAHASDEPLYVAVLGAPTNVASALAADPTIASKIVIVFVAGYPTTSPHVDDSFNLVQDRVATNRIFEADTNMVYLPGYQVSETLSVSLPELEANAAGRGPAGDLLVELYLANPLAAAPTTPGHSWIVWDLAPIAWLIDPSWVRIHDAPRAQVGPGHLWQQAAGTLTEAFRIDRRAVYTDLFARLGS